MTNRIIFLLLAGSVIMATACTSLKRYHSQAVSDVDSSLANVSLFASRLSKPEAGKTAKTLFDLSADAQMQFIKILDSRFTDNFRFFKALDYEYLKPETISPPGDFVKRDLKLIFSVSKQRDYMKLKPLQRSRLSPADRIEYLKISLAIKEPNLSFTSWDMYTTEYGSIDIGDVTFNRSLDITASASTSENKAKSIGSLSAEVKPSISRKEDQAIKYRYIKLNGRLNKGSIEMEEEGNREIDLTGNIIAVVSLQFDQAFETLTSISSLKDSAGGFNSPGKLSVENYQVAVPDIKKIKKEIQADLKIDFIYRNVRGGRKTFPEWDDRVRYYSGHRERPVTLFRDVDYVPGFCCIGSGHSAKDKILVSIERQDKQDHPVIFRTYEEAKAFYLWLDNYLKKNPGKSVKIGGGLLKFNGTTLTYDEIRNESDFGIVLYYR